jgi:hypothetical protein
MDYAINHMPVWAFMPGFGFFNSREDEDAKCQAVETRSVVVSEAVLNALPKPRLITVLA